ncbi:immune inhibitor A domain-containing protein [Knoellia aerolata]|uniref:Protease n=1 Tax=Knoellia aerolata DSM 18566 TaxID=1385519 RepID=A0A0A0JZC3_9MICO|nr:immune inhibitor A domain-containing protein [Knoellia aerolata]KGN42493.1 protease [Knoellia aerolata DSM 18566]
MTQRHTRALAGLAGAALVVSLAPMGAQAKDAAPPAADTKASTKKQDDLPNPLGDAARTLRQDAVTQLVKGTATTETRGGQRVIKLKGNPKAAKGSPAAKDRFVSYPVNREESIFTILGEFGSQVHPTTGGTPGPLHNQIAEPDRNWDGDATDDNSTEWSANYDRAHYQDLMFGEGESFKDFYLKQSNGRFLAKGDVSDWVKVPYNAARYGSNKISDAQGAWPFVEHSATAWFESQKAAGKTDAEIKTYLEQFDKVDRYDYDGDGNFAEADGYIDHFQAIHAGAGEEAGGGAQGEDAIWSHRWYVNYNQAGKTGPAFNKAGGVPLGNTGIWIGDYTTEPENGGLGVFAHEFGHDLGLPDYYDTAGGDNGTGFWTLMSGGSWLNDGGEDIGSKPGYMGPLEKLQLGWLDYTVAGKSGTYTLGQADLDGATTPQAVIVPLPDKKVVTKYNTPHSGTAEWWSGSGNDLKNSITRDVDLTGKTSASMSAWLDYDIEEGYDYLYVQASADGGATWTDVAAIDGASNGWTQKSFDLTAFAGKQAKVRFNYVTDGGLALKGAFIDDITITADGATVLNDTVESGANGWTAVGFTIMSGTTDKMYPRWYMAENRVYSGYDTTLKTGPYNFGWSSTKPDWVERFPYQNGMLVWYVDGSFADNNTITHPGGGMSLPVDARPAPVKFPGGQLLGNRRQPWDATFGQEKTDSVTFHRNGVPVTIGKQAAIPTFDDTDPNRYWTADNPMSSVKVAGLGTKITVARTTKGGTEMQLKITLGAK